MKCTKWALALSWLIATSSAVDGASAQVQFDVNSTEDGRDADVSDGICEAENGFCTIRAAIEQANSLRGADVVYIPEMDTPYLMSVKDASDLPEPFTVYDYLDVIGDGPEQSLIDNEARGPMFSVRSVEALVLDPANQRIARLPWHGFSDGVTFASIPFANPGRMIFGPVTLDEDILVTTLADGVLRYSHEDGSFVGTLIPPVVDGTPIAPNDVAFGPNGSVVANHIFVSNLFPGGGVYHFSETGAFIDVFDTGGDSAAGMEWIGAAGHELVVALPSASRLASFDELGNQLSDFATAAPDHPRDLVERGDYLYVSADDNDGVWRFDINTRANENFVAPGEGGLDQPRFMSFAPSGELFVHSSGTGEILRYDGTTGNFAGVFAASGEGGLAAAGPFLLRSDSLNPAGPLVSVTGMTFARGGLVGGRDSCFTVYQGAFVEVTDTNIRDCFSSQFGGGVQNRGTLYMERVSITGNQLGLPAPGGQTSQGGGVFNDGHLFITDSLIANNFAGRGGGISAYYSAYRTDLVNTTVSGNVSVSEGAVRVLSGTINISNSTIVQNQTPGLFDPDAQIPVLEGSYASGLYVVNGASAFVGNTIIADNIGLLTFDDNYAPDCFSVSVDGSTVPGHIVSLTDNLFGVVNDRCGIVDKDDNFPVDLLAGSESMPFDPELFDLADNGGPTLTHLPMPGSPVIDGDLTDYTLPLFNCLDHDQRLLRRPIDGDEVGDVRCDIGAVEARPSTATDFDADGLMDVIDPQPNQFSFFFTDASQFGNTSGMVLSYGSQLLTVEDAADSDEGVTISADSIGSADPAVLALCDDEVIVEISAGETLTVTCVSADAGPDQTFECESQQAEAVTLSGSGAAFSGGAVTYQWEAQGATLDDATTPVASGSFPLGTTVATLTVTRGNEVAFDDAIIDVVDTTPPSISAPPNVVTSDCLNVNVGQATASDTCGGSVTISNDAPASFKAGIWTITWTATDASGNQAQSTQQVTVGLGETAACCPVGSNIILGTSNNDNLFGTSGPDCILGFGAQDTLNGFGGNDILSGGEGDDILVGGSGSDLLDGGNGQDSLSGQDQSDALFGGGGDDDVHGGSGDDSLHGGDGQDDLFGDDGNDSLFGDTGDDTLQGGEGSDFHDGGGLHDQCFDDVATSVFVQCENQAPSGANCDDGLQNGDETGVDCGGSCPDPCSGCNAATYEAETMFHSTGGSTTDGWSIWANGFISTNHDFTPGPSTITVIARGQPAQFVWPHMLVRVGGVVVGDIFVDSFDWAPFSFDFDASGGSQEIRVEFDNDFYAPPQDRNLFVDQLSVDCD